MTRVFEPTEDQVRQYKHDKAVGIHIRFPSGVVDFRKLTEISPIEFYWFKRNSSNGTGKLVVASAACNPDRLSRNCNEAPYYVCNGAVFRVEEAARVRPGTKYATRLDRFLPAQ